MREAQVVGLRGVEVPTLEDVEQRRLHLWVGLIVLVVAIAVALVVLEPSPHIEVALLGLVLVFAAYSIDKELRLRRLTRHLLGERDLVTALSNRLEELAALLDAGRAVNAGLELPEVLRRILDNALDLLDASDGSVMLVEEPGVLRAECVRGNEAARDSSVAFGQGIAGRVAESREALLIQGELVGVGRRRRAPHSAMSVPLVHRGGLLGVLNVNAEPGRIFDEYDLRALSLFGEHAASSIANARLFEAERANAIALAHRAYHDPLTDLANRTLFAERVGYALQSERIRPIAVVFLDLDDFKKINDSLGHAAGDELLVQVASRLQLSLREEDVAARLGGDEFAVLLEDLPSADEAQRAAERLLLSLSGPIDVGDRLVTVRASVGVAVGQPGASTAQELLRNADVAMYIAKGQGKGCVRLFEAAMHTALMERLQLETELERAVEMAELELHYQPIVSLESGRVSGFEALVRWNHPTRGLLPPDAFIPLAEETGLIKGIDRWVLLKACVQGKAWQRQFAADDPLTVAVNLSARQLEDERSIDLVKLALEVSGLDPESLVVEITESFVLKDEVVGARRLAALRELGVRVAIDDFGTGYSSLSYLRRLPVDVLKIDRSFIDGLGRSDEDAALVQAILRLARSLNLETIAEGVERPDQRATLADMHCTLAQGWHFSRPLVHEEMEVLLASRTSALPAGTL